MRKFTFLLTVLLLNMVGGTKVWADESITSTSALYVLESDHGGTNYLEYSGGSGNFSITGAYNLNSVFEFTLIGTTTVGTITYNQYTISAYNAEGNPYIYFDNVSTTNYTQGKLKYETVDDGADLSKYYWILSGSDQMKKCISQNISNAYYPINCDGTNLTTWSADYANLSDKTDNFWNFTEVYVYEIENPGVNGTAATLSYNGSVISESKIVVPVSAVASDFTVSGVPGGYTATVTLDTTEKKIKVTYEKIDMTAAPVQNGWYLIKSKHTGGDYYLQYNAERPENLSYGSKTADGNSYLQVTCIEKSGDTYYYTLKVGDKYVYTTGYGYSDGNSGTLSWPMLKTIGEGTSITETERWVFKKQSNGYFNISPNGTGYSMNPWYDGTPAAPVYKVGYWAADAGDSNVWSFAPVYPVTLNDAGGDLGSDVAAVGTFSCIENNTTLPTDVNAYYTTTQGGNYVTLTQFTGNVLPMNEGFILTGDAGTVYLESTTAEATAIEGTNSLKAATGEKIDDGINAYVLAGGADGVGFYLLSSTERDVAKGKAYLKLDNAQASIKMNFDGAATGIENVETVETNVNAPIYDLSGRRVMNATKGGIYIQNGKKFIVK